MFRAVAVIVVVYAGEIVAADSTAQESRKEKIAAALQRWSDSIDTLQLKCEWSWNAPDVAARGRDKRSGFHWTWARGGRTRQYQWSRKDGKLSDTLTTFDGKEGFKITNPRGDPPKNFDNVENTHFANAGPKRLSPDGLIATLSSGTVWAERDSLSELLRRKPMPGLFNGVETEVFHEGNTLKVKVSVRTGIAQETPHVTWFTLDPKHGYLPRPKEEVGGFRQEIHKFLYVDPPGIWFPTRGAIASSSSEYQRFWRVTDVRINVALDDGAFSPPIPEGTRIRDRTGKTRGSYRSGDRKKEQREQQRKQGRETWLAWLIVLTVAAVCVWMGARTWRQLRR